MGNTQLTITDMVSIKNIIDAACTRGAFKAAEMAAVGGVFNKLDTFLSAVVPAQKAPEAAEQTAQPE
jgi:hypothetical protein